MVSGNQCLCPPPPIRTSQMRDLVATRAIIGATRGNVRFDKILASTHSYSFRERVGSPRVQLVLQDSESKFENQVQAQRIDGCDRWIGRTSGTIFETLFALALLLLLFLYFCRNGDEDGDEDALSAITCGGVKRWIYCSNS